jgi:hypothetical protein
VAANRLARRAALENEYTQLKWHTEVPNWRPWGFTNIDVGCEEDNYIASDAQGHWGTECFPKDWTAEFPTAYVLGNYKLWIENGPGDSAQRSHFFEIKDDQM